MQVDITVTDPESKIAIILWTITYIVQEHLPITRGTTIFKLLLMLKAYKLEAMSNNEIKFNHQDDKTKI